MTAHWVAGSLGEKDCQKCGQTSEIVGKRTLDQYVTTDSATKTCDAQPEMNLPVTSFALRQTVFIRDSLGKIELCTSNS